MQVILQYVGLGNITCLLSSSSFLEPNHYRNSKTSIIRVVLAPEPFHHALPALSVPAMTVCIVEV